MLRRLTSFESSGIRWSLSRQRLRVPESLDISYFTTQRSREVHTDNLDYPSVLT